METFPQIITVKNQEQGLSVAKDILYKKVSNQTLLFLSGGKTPKELYEKIAEEKTFNVGAVAMIDERFGFKNHHQSNERMIRETGLLSYLEEKKIPFYPILRLHPRGVASDFVRDYSRKIKYLLKHFSKSVAIMGIGEDGHTAGIPAGVKSEKLKVKSWVTGINNFPGKFKERMTLTFKALSQMDCLIVLVFGSSKRNALRKMFEQGSLEEIPARFYVKPEIARKTILITDQKI